MIRLTLKKFDLLNPTWSPAALKAGQEATLRVDAPDISNTDVVRFEILRGNETIDVVSAAPGKTSVKWTPPNLTGNHNLTFRAALIEEPSPENGHSGVLAAVVSGNAALQGFSIAITTATTDACFVPKQEALKVDYNVTDAGSGAKKGRIEIWGERYPGDTPAPLYAEDFSPANGAGTWSSWHGKANAGHLKGAYITPEFSPYKVRLIIGPDTASVKDPHGAGQGKVAIAEGEFEIIVHSVKVRLQENLKEAAKLDEHKFEEVLAVEPRQADGSYAEMERLPNDGEIGRLRIPMAQFKRRADSGSQGGNNVGDPYFDTGGPTKHAVDIGFYTRPEIPIEFVAHLRSHDNTINNDATKRGLFEKEALGPLKIEPVAMDYYPTALYAGTTGTYFQKAALRVKEGTHNAPVNAANQPSFPSWQARFVATLNQQDFDVSTVSPDYSFTQGSNELTVYLNLAKLELSARGDDNELDDGSKGYRETSGTVVHLGANRVEANDVVWVVRTTGAGATRWNQFPPGTNCHEHYGGVRGKQPTADLSNYFRSNYSPDPANPFEPIIGKSKGTYPYTDYIQLRPNPAVPQNEQERAEITAMSSGSHKGVAGVLFSPSCIAGDQYELYPWIDYEPYERSFRFIQRKPRINTDKTGVIQIWRRLQFAKSLRQAGIADAGAPYHGDGVNMSISAMNTQYQNAFTEWTISDKAPVHKDIDLKKYRKAHNLHSNAFVGKVPLNNNAAVTNTFIQYDYYREELPPNTAFPNRAANALAGVAKGTASQTAGGTVVAAFGGHGADVAVRNAGVAAIPVYGGTPANYFFQAFGRWKGIVYNIVDTLTPRDASPRRMNVVRWANLHEAPLWNNSAGNAVGTSGTRWEGEGMGDGNSVFRTSVLSATLFAHEMGHCTHLIHFVAGNFCWKHHDLNAPDCLMSYTFTQGYVWKPGGGVGPNGAGGLGGPPPPWPLAHGGTDVEHGWPHRANNPAIAALAWCIRYGPGIALGGLCAKCLLKLRGWKEDVLPVAWSHPDLF